MTLKGEWENDIANNFLSTDDFAESLTIVFIGGAPEGVSIDVIVDDEVISVDQQNGTQVIFDGMITARTSDLVNSTSGAAFIRNSVDYVVDRFEPDVSFSMTILYYRKNPETGP